VLAHRPPQEASDRLSRVCTKSAKSASGTLGAHFVISKWYSKADLMQKNNICNAHIMHTMSKLYAHYVHTMHVTPRTPKRRVDRAVLGDRKRCGPLTKTYGKSAGMVWGRWDHFCDIRFLSVTLRQVVHVTPRTPKRRVDWAVLGACQRCSPLTKTYGKSAGMVWGRRDHFCDIRFLSVHMRLAPAATFGARFLRRASRR
jgi:hypothetical protein